MTEVSVAPVEGGYVRVSSVRIPSSRVRTDYGDVEDLAASISEIGMVSAILIDRDWNLIAGHRRLLAAQFLGLETVPARVIDAKDPEAVELAENARRKQFTPQEIGEWADRNWESDWAKSASGDRRDAIGKKLGVSGVQAQRCRDLVRKVRENPADADVLQIAADKGAKAAERELDRRTETDRPMVDVAGLHACDGFGLAERMEGFAKVAVCFHDGAGVWDSVLSLASTRLLAGGVALVGAEGDSIPQLIAEADDFSALDFKGLAVCADGKEARAYVRLSNLREYLPPQLVSVYSARTMRGAIRAMIQAHSSERDLVVDPCMGDGVHALACDGRRFLGADLDPANVEKVREALS